MDQKPTVGRIVHYHRTPGTSTPQAAIITEVGSWYLKLTVFPSCHSVDVDAVPNSFSDASGGHMWVWPPRE